MGRLRGTSVSKAGGAAAAKTGAAGRRGGEGKISEDAEEEEETDESEATNEVNEEEVMRAAAMLNVNGAALSDFSAEGFGGTGGGKKGVAGGRKKKGDKGPSRGSKEDSGGTGTLDIHDPWEILRKLLVKCETLSAENKKLKRHQFAGSGGSSGASAPELAELRKELEELRRENANMYLLREENRALKKETEGIKTENGELRMRFARAGGEGGMARSTAAAEAREGVEGGGDREEGAVPSLNFARLGGGGGGQAHSAWGSIGSESQTADQLPMYPDVGVPTPRSSESGGSSRSGSRPGTATASGRSRPGSARSSRPGSARSSRPGSAGGQLYDDGGAARPQTASERIEVGYLQKLREEAGLKIDNPNDENVWENDEDGEDNEILDLIERNESGLAKIRQDLVDANKDCTRWELAGGLTARGEASGGGSGGSGVKLEGTGKGKENSGGGGREGGGAGREEGKSAGGVGGGGGAVAGLSVRQLLEMRKKAAAAK